MAFLYCVARMRESIMEGQDELILLRKSDSDELGLVDDSQAVSDDAPRDYIN